MSTSVIALISVGVLLAVIVIIILFLVSIYNRLVKLRNRYENAFSQIDVQLKRRYDLIPNLVETAKGFMKHEKETLEAVISARNQAATASNKAAQNPGEPTAMKALIGAETALTGALGKLFAVVEAYPDIKSDQHMSQLMEEMTSTENKISFARQAYNDSVTMYNTNIEIFPNVVLAGPMGFKPTELFEIENVEQRDAPKVKF